MNKTESGLGSKADDVTRRHKRTYVLTVVFIACVGIAGAVLTAMGHPVFGDEAQGWLRILFMALLFLPVINLFVLNMFYSSELEDAVARPYSGPQQSVFTLRVPSKADQKSASYVMIPFSILAVVILLAVFLVPVIGDAVIAAGAPFEIFNAVLIGIAAVVAGVAVWAALRFTADAKRQRAFREEFLAALSQTGFSWAKRDLRVVPADYTDGDYVSLKDSAGLTSKWNVTWNGEVATLTHLPSEM